MTKKELDGKIDIKWSKFWVVLLDELQKVCTISIPEDMFKGTKWTDLTKNRKS